MERFLPNLFVMSARRFVVSCSFLSTLFLRGQSRPMQPAGLDKWKGNKPLYIMTTHTAHPRSIRLVWLWWWRVAFPVSPLVSMSRWEWEVLNQSNERHSIINYTQSTPVEGFYPNLHHTHAHMLTFAPERSLCRVISCDLSTENVTLLLCCSAKLTDHYAISRTFSFLNNNM